MYGMPSSNPVEQYGQLMMGNPPRGIQGPQPSPGAGSGFTRPPQTYAQGGGIPGGAPSPGQGTYVPAPFGQSGGPQQMGPNYGAGQVPNAQAGQMNFTQTPGQPAAWWQPGFQGQGQSLMEQWGHLWNPQPWGAQGLQNLGGMFQQNPDYMTQFMQLLQNQNQGGGAPPNPGVPFTPGVDLSTPGTGPLQPTISPQGYGQKRQDIAAWQAQRLQGNAPVNPGDPAQSKYHGIFGSSGGMGQPWNPRQGY